MTKTYAIELDFITKLNQKYMVISSMLNKIIRIRIFYHVAHLVIIENEERRIIVRNLATIHKNDSFN